MNKERKIRLIEQITELFAEQGYASLSVSAIAAKCKLSKPTLYYYFESKENLLISIVQHYGGLLREELSIASSLKKPDLALVELVDRFLKFTSDNPSYFRLYLSLIFTPHENRAYQIIKTEAEELQRIVESILNVVLKNKKPTSLLAVSLIGQMNSFATIILNGYVSYSVDLSKQVVQLFKRGADSYGKSG